MEEKKNTKEPQTVEKSLGYLSWSMKELVIELKKVNEHLERLVNNSAKNIPF